jgi:alkaline phosphatase D
MSITRRLFVLRCTALASTAWAAPSFTKNPFSLGVASGDPSSDGFVLWTRIAPDPVNGGGMGKDPIPVDWQIAEDDNMRKVVKKGRTTASPLLAHSVHVEASGLKPARPYWYQFKVGRDTSPIGRALTAPHAGDMQPDLKFAFASCQRWDDGYFTAYEHMREDAPDLVIHLGDYIYEYGPLPNKVRPHNSPEIISLSDYRNRHALYKTDPALQNIHAHCPWIVTWDDHEVDNNYANDIPEDNQPREAFLERRANAYQAYYEHLPLRLAAQPKGSKAQMYRTVPFGDLVNFIVLDTRQYRTDQPCGDNRKHVCDGVFDPQATILGDEQEAWLKRELDRSHARWNVIANQVLMARIDSEPGPGETFSMDQWSGYEVCRDRVMKFLRDRRPNNPIVITGDIHTNWVSDLKVEWLNEKAPVVGTEFIGTSITTSGDGADDSPQSAAWYRENPTLKMFNARRGYVNVSLTKEHCQADYRVVPYVTKPGAPVKTHSSWVVDNGRLGVRKA